MKVNTKNLLVSASLCVLFYGIGMAMDDSTRDSNYNSQSGFHSLPPGALYPQANMVNQPQSFSMGYSPGSSPVNSHNTYNPQPGFNSLPFGQPHHQANMANPSHSMPASPLESLDPMVLDRLMYNIKEAEKGVAQQIGQMGSNLAQATRVVVLGVTGSGKSTLLHALAGKKLMVRKGSGKMEIDVAPGETLPGFAVGHGVTSVTTLPVSWYDESNKVFYWDCPGFMDTRGPEQDIVNAFAVDSLFEPPARIKTLLVLQESEITDSRMTNALSRLDKLGKLLTDQRQLQDSLSLVVTKGDGEFEPVDMLKDVMETMRRERLSIHPLIRFFSERPDLVFSLPKPSRSADGKEYNPLFKDRERIIRNLQTYAVENPIHSINLDAHSVVYVTHLMSRIDNVDELIGRFAGYMQDEYRTKQLEDLRNWSDFIEKLSGLKDHEIDRPEKLVSFLETIPSNQEKFRDVIERISSTRRIFSFLEKVSRDELSATIKLKTIPEVLRPLLKNIKAELHEMIQSKELIELQKEKTQEIEEELQKQKEEADQKQEEHRKQLEDLEARAMEETSELRNQLDEEVKAGKLAREEAEKRMKEYEEKSAEELKKARAESEMKIVELQEKVEQEKVNASKAVEEMRNEISQKERQTEQRIRDIQESSRQAAEETRRQAQAQMAAMENRVKEAESKLEKAKKRSSSQGGHGYGGRVGFVFIPGHGWALARVG